MFEHLRRWIEETPHREHCGAISAQSDRACTCGKSEALAEISDLELEQEIKRV